jgi:hypothetical protein
MSLEDGHRDPFLFAHQPRFVIDGNAYRIDQGCATLVSIREDVADPLIVPQALLHDRTSFRVSAIHLIHCSAKVHRVYIPRSVLTIQGHSFASCHKLTSVEFPSGADLREIDGFQDCGLVRIEIPDHVEVIHAAAFADCRSLQHVGFGVESRIRQISGFRGTALSQICFPPSLQVLGPGAFLKCRELRLMEFSELSEVTSLVVANRGPIQVNFPSSLRVAPTLLIEGSAAE